MQIRERRRWPKRLIYGVAIFLAVLAVIILIVGLTVARNGMRNHVQNETQAFSQDQATQMTTPCGIALGKFFKMLPFDVFHSAFRIGLIQFITTSASTLTSTPSPTPFTKTLKSRYYHM